MNFKTHLIKNTLLLTLILCLMVTASPICAKSVGAERSSNNLIGATDLDELKAEQVLSDFSAMEVYLDATQNLYGNPAPSVSGRTVHIPETSMAHVTYSTALTIHKRTYEPGMITLTNGRKLRCGVAPDVGVFVVEGIRGFFRVEESYLEDWNAMLQAEMR